MEKIKKIVVIFMAVCIALNLAVVPGGRQKAQAAELSSGNCTYKVLDAETGTIEIDKYTGTDSVVEIPDTIDGKRVVSIGTSAFQGCAGLTSVSVTENVQSIGSNAFFGCSNLSNITIPDRVTSIGSYAFYGCSSLTGIRIPSGITSLESNVFSLCTGLREITIPYSVTSIGRQAFYCCAGLTEIKIPGNVKSIGVSAFESCINLTEITILDGVESIGDSAFKGCTALNKVNYSGTQEQWDKLGVGAANGNEALATAVKKYEQVQAYYGYEILKDGTIGITEYIGPDSKAVVDIPERIDGKSVTVIGEAAFSEHTGFNEIVIPQSVSEIGETAFQGCTGLSKINLPDKITAISDSLFRGCTSLKTIHLSENVTNIALYAFAESGLEEITIPGNVVNMGIQAFGDCHSLRKVVLSNGIPYVGIDSFNGCTSLREITFPDSVTEILEGAFARCTSLTNVTLPSGMTLIAPRVFCACTGLKEITIPSSVTKVMASAFAECTELKDINFLGTKEQWEKIVKDYDDSDECFDNATVHYAETPDGTFQDFQYHTLSDGTIEITKYNGTGKSAEIPEKINEKSVTGIASSAFAGCSALETITIPVSVKSIKENAFLGCESLKVVNYAGTKQQWDQIQIAETGNLPLLNAAAVPSGDYTYKYLEDGTVEIKKYVGADSKTEAEAPEKINEKSVTSIGESAFEKCSNLKKITLPNSITNIGNSAFADCENLKEITIPISVTSIKGSAFSRCTGLSDVYYPGTEEQWKKISIDATGNEALQKATIHYNYGQKPEIPDEPVIEETVDAKQALESLKAGDALALLPAFQPYLSETQIDTMESYLYTWLAEINYAYQYSGNSDVKERLRKKAGIDPKGDFTSGMETAITHISVDTKYGKKTFEITLDLGKPDASGSLYPSYGAMRYELLQKDGVPGDVTKDGRIGKAGYADIGAFVKSFAKSAEDTLHGTYQWKELDAEMTAGVLADKTIAEIIGNKKGSFSDGTFVIYEKPLFAYSKKVTIACPVDVRVFTMEGKEAGAIVNNQASEKDEHVRLDVNGDVKTVYLSGNDYYLDLRGTGTGKMNYTVEEIANEDVCRNVQFLELQLKKDLQYEGYVFRPLNIDSDLYALRKVEGSEKETVFSDKDSYEALFKKVQGLTLSHGEATLDKNRKVQLNATLYPLDASNKGLQWTADNQSVLSVDENGLVTAVGAGSATVTVSTKDGSFLKQYCVFNVKGGDNGNNNGNGSNGNGTGSNGGSGSNGNSSNGNGAGNSGSPGTSDNAPDNSKPSLEPETPPVVTALHYVLQFQTNGGVNLSRRTMTLLADDNPGIMPKIQKKGYVFDGWYTQQSGGERITGDKPLKAAATLYAHWTKAKAPKKASAPTLKSKKKGKLKVTYKKIKGAAGYELQYSADKKFTSKKTKRLGKSENGKTISGLKAGKKYYARVRAYNVDSMGNKLYGKYSKAKGVKIKG